MGFLEGKQALVTGGGTGVGAAIALALADAGASVTITGRRQEPLDTVAAQRGTIKSHIADVTDSGSVSKLYGEIGPVDIVVANAGAAESAPFGKVGLDHWQRMIDVNLTGVFLTLQGALPGMLERGFGRMISVASTAGLKGYPYVAPYCAAKHGVIGLTKALALETAKTGVTVNALCPGFVDTPLLDQSVQNIVDKTGRSAEEARKMLAANNPQGRLIDPSEVAETLLWLCRASSGSVTGQAISISGGEI